MASTPLTSAALYSPNSLFHFSERYPQIPVRISFSSLFQLHSRYKNNIRHSNRLARLKASAMPVSRVAPVTKDSWESLVLKSDIPVLVEFYASWCGPCKMVHEIIDEVAVEYAGKLNCFILNTEKDTEITKEYEIRTVPIVLLFIEGIKCDFVVGFMPKKFYVTAIERILKW